jgi:hypothetical protein
MEPFVFRRSEKKSAQKCLTGRPPEEGREYEANRLTARKESAGSALSPRWKSGSAPLSRGPGWFQNSGKGYLNLKTDCPSRSSRRLAHPPNTSERGQEVRRP